MAGLVFDSQQKIGTFGIVMFTISMILSFVGMVLMAKLGTQAIFYYGVVVLFFFLPCVIVTLELARRYPNGGFYQWIKNAFGERWAFIALWMQWGVVIITMPQLFTFIAGIFAYVVHPAWIHQAWYIFTVCVLLSLFSLAVSNFGIKASSILTTYAVITTLVLPVLLILVFSVIWLIHGLPVKNHLNWHHLLPSFGALGTYALLGTGVMAFSGVEAPAYLIQYVKKQRQFIRGVIIGCIAIIILNILVTLALTMFVSSHHESIIAGMIQSLLVFLDYFHLHWVIYIYAVLGLFGYAGVLTSLMITYAEGVCASSRDGLLPAFLARKNRHGAPINILMVQIAIGIALSALFLVIPHVSHVYWMINAMVAIGLCMRYVIFFIARFKLTDPSDTMSKRYRYNIISTFGLLSALLGIIVLYFPPGQFPVGRVWIYETVLGLCTLSFLFIPYMVLQCTTRRDKMNLT